jgi:hypothetical protein
MATPPFDLPRMSRPDARQLQLLEGGLGRPVVLHDRRRIIRTARSAAFTHGVQLSPAKSAELDALVGTMIELKYLGAGEVPQLPHRTSPLQIAAYAPIALATFVPDVVVFRGNVRQIMLLSEAGPRGWCVRAGDGHGTSRVQHAPMAAQSGPGLRASAVSATVFTRASETRRCT